MRAIQKRTTIHIIGPCIGAFGIDNGDLILGGQNCGLTLYGVGFWAIFKRELVDLITFGLHKQKSRGERNKLYVINGV